MQPNPLRSDGGDDNDEMQPDEVWQLAHRIGYTPHWTRWLVIRELEREGVWPINSSAVRRRVIDRLGTKPSRDQILSTRDKLVEVGALQTEELDEWPGGDHWTTTEKGHQLARAVTMQWCEMLGCPEAAEALRACADDDSTDSDDQ